jgi:hypothetical protein
MPDRVPYSNQTIIMECGLVLHCKVIGLPYFCAPLIKDTEAVTVEPKTKVSVN